MSARPRRKPTLLNAASVPGTMMMDWAKMMGITPAELIRRGMKLFCPSRTRPRPMTFRGICTGSFRDAMVMATTPATMAIITTIRMTSFGQLITPDSVASQVDTMAPGKPSMMEKKISSEAPLPMPCSVICSPSHMMNRAPVVRTSVVLSTNRIPVSSTAPGMLWR